MAPLQALSTRDSGGGLLGFMGLHRASTVSTNDGTSNGKTVGSTASTSKGETHSINRTIQHRPLVRVDELARYFDRDAGLQLVFMGGGQPLALRRTPYYREEEAEFAPLRKHLAGTANATAP